MSVLRRAVVKKQMYRVRSEMRRVQEALDAGSEQELYAAFERAQMAAFDGKAYIAHGTIPDDEQVSA